MRKKVLYWPGMGQNIEILKEFRREISKDFKIDIINFKYDKGNLNPKEWKILENTYEWWIGISLGASLAYYAYNYVKISNRPKRITIINPFSSRKILSNEKKFDMTKQWDFSPIENTIKIEKIDLVSSVFDTEIPMYHGIDLLNSTISEKKKIIFINSNHTIDDNEAQEQLAKILLGKSEKNARANYCNVYKQFRDI